METSSQNDRKIIVPDEGSAIEPLGWYERNGQIVRAYGISYQGERVEIHMLDQTLLRPDGGGLGKPYERK